MTREVGSRSAHALRGQTVDRRFTRGESECRAGAQGHTHAPSDCAAAQLRNQPRGAAVDCGHVGRTMVPN